MSSEFSLKIDDLTSKLHNFQRLKTATDSLSQLQTKVNRKVIPKMQFLQNIKHRTAALEQQIKIVNRVNQSNHRTCNQLLQQKKDWLAQEISKKIQKKQKFVENMEFELRKTQINQQIINQERYSEMSSKMALLDRQMETELFSLGKQADIMQQECHAKRQNINKIVDQNIKDIEFLMIQREKVANYLIQKAKLLNKSIKEQISNIEIQFNSFLTKGNQQLSDKDEATKKIIKALLELV